MDLQELLGEELYNQVMEKAGDHKIVDVSEGSYIPKEKFDEKNDEVKEYKRQLDNQDEQLENLKKKAEGHDELQSTIDTLRTENQSAKDQYEQQLRDQKFNYELERNIVQSRPKNSKAVMGLLDRDTIKLDNDGEIKGLSEQLENLKDSDAYLFETDEPANPAPSNTTHQPGSNSKTNNPTPSSGKDKGRQRAQERYGLNKGEE